MNACSRESPEIPISQYSLRAPSPPSNPNELDLVIIPKFTLPCLPSAHTHSSSWNTSSQLFCLEILLVLQGQAHSLRSEPLLHLVVFTEYRACGLAFVFQVHVSLHSGW